MTIQGVPASEPMVQVPLCVALSSLGYHRVGVIKSLSLGRDRSDEDQEGYAKSAEVEAKIGDALEACIVESTGSPTLGCPYTDWLGAGTLE